MDSCEGVNSPKLPSLGQECIPSSQNHQAPIVPALAFSEALISHAHTHASLHSSLFQAQENHNLRFNLQAQALRASNSGDAMSFHQLVALGIRGYNPQFYSPALQGPQDQKTLLKNTCSGSLQAGEAPSQAFMNALALLRQNIEHLQTLVQLVAQGGHFGAAAIQQQMKAAAGMATVISQLIAVAAGLLPQSHQQSTQSAFCYTANNSATGAIPGMDLFQNNSSDGSLAAAFGVFDGDCTVDEEKQNSMDMDCYLGGSGLDVSMDFATEHFLTTNRSSIPTGSSLRTSVANVEVESELNTSRPRFTGKISSRKSGLEVVNDSPGMLYEPLDMNGNLEDQDLANALHDEEDEDEAEHLPIGSYELIELDAMEILAEHTHFCEICGKGFKRDANLRMHMRGHGDEYKTAAALAKPDKMSQDESLRRPRRYSCPYPGCKRNKKHKKFVPLKTMLCVKNHYRRSHCPKILTCSKCKAKTFSVVADLKTHEKHCGQEKWQCSCGTTFSRKDKLLGHVALFIGHTPATTRIFDTESSGVGDKGKNEMGLCSVNSNTVNSLKRFAKCTANAGSLGGTNGSRLKVGENSGASSDTKPEVIPAAVLAGISNSGLAAKVGGSNLVWKDSNRLGCSLNSSESENGVAISESQISAFSSIGQVGDVSLLAAASNLHGVFGNSFAHSPNVTN